MTLQALLVSKDDHAAETLAQVLAQFGMAATRKNVADAAVERLTQEYYDQVIVDFDDPETASLVLETCRRLGGSDRNPPVTVALLPDAGQIRAILGAGTHFILTKPVSHAQAQATLRAATAILKQERRESARIAVPASVAVQAPVSIRVDESNAVESILLDLSTGGMHLLAAKPLPSSAQVRVCFELPDGIGVEAEAEVAWSTDNGETGLRFLDMDAKLRETMNQWLASHAQDAPPEEGDASPCKLTDLSLGACYVQTESPFPQSSAVDLSLRAAGMEVHAEGLVRVMHPGHGMGIELPSRTEEQRRSVEEFIAFLTSQPGTQPQLEAAPRSLVASADLTQNTIAENDAEDPLLDLLRSGAEMDEEDFLAELARQRTSADVANNASH